MRLWMLAAGGIWLALSYFLLNWAFWLSILAIVIYIIYVIKNIIERWMTPHGKRIKHGMLRGHLQNEYGTKDGGKIYKEIVGELRQRGYR